MVKIGFFQEYMVYYTILTNLMVILFGKLCDTKTERKSNENVTWCRLITAKYNGLQKMIIWPLNSDSLLYWSCDNAGFFFARNNFQIMKTKCRSRTIFSHISFQGIMGRWVFEIKNPMSPVTWCDHKLAWKRYCWKANINWLKKQAS